MSNPVIYVPKGRAGEYADLACNLYTGCSHGCRYCYGSRVLHVTRQEFDNPSPRPLIVQRLQASALDRESKGKAGSVLLCFTCDPYQPLEARYGITRRAIEILHDTGHNVTILTKAGQLPRRDFDLLQAGDSFAVTLTCQNRAQQELWEPQAGTTEARLQLLREAAERDIYTWASFEPVIYPQDTLALIRKAAPWIDECKVGKLNYNPWANRIDWPAFVEEATTLLDRMGIQYLIKRDTLEAGRRK